MSNKLDEMTILLYINWILEQCNTPVDEVRYLISIIQDKNLSNEGRLKVLRNNIYWTLEELAEVKK